MVRGDFQNDVLDQIGPSYSLRYRMTNQVGEREKLKQKGT